jgi:succinoglycan biosynthesis protein ExoO
MNDNELATHPTPRVSVIMANYRGSNHLAAALESVLAQTMSDLELIVVDDASPDDSAAIVRRFMDGDQRVKLIVAERNGGPGAARNRGLDAATGEWIAIVDSDDLLHAERLERLIGLADDLETDAVADDLLYFSEVDRRADRTLLGAAAPGVPKPVTVAQFVRSNSSQGPMPPLGYLKPLIRRSALGAIRYDEDVRIAEDYDFLLRFLLSGGSLMLVPEPFYLYRRHPASLSHRLSEHHLEAMIANHRRLYARGFDLPPSTRALLDYRLEALHRSLVYERLVATLKNKEWMRAAGQIAGSPSLLVPLFRSVREHVSSRRAVKTVFRREATSILLTADPSSDVSSAARRKLGIEDGAAFETIVVPPYPTSGTARDVGLEQALWCKLADISVAGDVKVIAHGRAGLYAASFMPARSSLTALLEEHEDEETPSRWARDPRIRFLRWDGREISGHDPRHGGADTPESKHTPTPLLVGGSGR